MATTSGTVNATQVDITTLMEHSVRRCGVLPSMFSSELQLAAKESLFFLLADLANDGISLWCVDKVVIPTVIGQTVYVLPPGTTDILNANYRTSVTLTGVVTSGAGYVGITFPVATSPTNVEISFTAVSQPTLVIESSPDGVTWTQVAAFAVQQSTLSAGQALAQDIDNSVPQLYWRVSDTSGVIPPASSVVWTNTPTEVPMTSFNKDDYFSLPNKTFTSSKSLQYWLDKQISPQIWVWPVPNTYDNQMVVQYHRLIQDVGSLSGLLEVPSRWFEYVIFAWACRIALEVPPALLPPNRLEYLEGQREAALDRAATGEGDGAPYRVQPNLRGYT